MKEIIKKYNGNLYTIIFDDDFENKNDNWLIAFNKNKSVRCVYKNKWDKINKKNIWIYAHRVITNAKKGHTVDHIDCNPLDNQKSNLRICSQAENSKNRSIQKGNKSGFKGVHFHNLTQKWRAQISINNKPKHIGLYVTKELAAQAYNEMAKELYKDFAKLNDVQCVV